MYPLNPPCAHSSFCCVPLDGQAVLAKRLVEHMTANEAEAEQVSCKHASIVESDETVEVTIVRSIGLLPLTGGEIPLNTSK